MTDWHILEVTSTKESAVCQILQNRLGAVETFFPQRRVQIRHRRGTRYVWRAYVPGYVFARFGDLQLHRVNGTHGRLSMRVMCPGGQPYRVTDEDLADMADVPKRVREAIAAVRAREAAERAAKAPQVGSPATVLDGPLAGLCGPVTAIRGDVVSIEGPTATVAVAAENVERVHDGA